MDAKEPGDGFIWIGNHVAADLCNTTPVVDGVTVELITDHAELLRWAAIAGIPVDGATGTPDEEARTLRFVHQLRQAVRVVLVGSAPVERGLASLNLVLALERGHLRVASFGEEQGDNVVLDAASGPCRFRLAVASAVVDIFEHSPGSIRNCARPGCVLLYLDTSRSGRRRWCDMATCGNRSKVAAHYARAHPG